MFAKFQLDISDDFYNSQINRPENIQTGNEISNCFGEESYSCMKEFICDNGEINGTALKEHWFKVNTADIFISHSHRDINKVRAFAGWLYHNFGLEAFIDLCTWGYADDLLKLLDDQYCWNKNSETYNYSLRNYTTSHVHMMLAIGYLVQYIMVFSTFQCTVLWGGYILMQIRVRERRMITRPHMNGQY